MMAIQSQQARRNLGLAPLIGLCVQTTSYVRFLIPYPYSHHTKGFQMLVSETKDGSKVQVGVSDGYLVASDSDCWVEGHIFHVHPDDIAQSKWDRHFIVWEATPNALQRYYSDDGISSSDRKRYGVPDRFHFGHAISGAAEVVLLPPDKTSSTGFFLAAIGLGATLSALSTNQNSKEPHKTRALETQ